MIALLLSVQILVLPGAIADEGQSGVVSASDGGEVPIVAPKLDKLAGVLAPELTADAGKIQIDGGQAAIVVPDTLSVYQVDLPAETAITAASLGLFFMVDVLVKPSLQGDVSCKNSTSEGRCNPNDLSSFDRYSVGKNSPEWSTFGDVALISSMVIPALYLGLESIALPTKEPWGDFARDMLVITEAVSMTASMDTILKFAFRRPRPSRYLPSGQSTLFDAELSLPSGHSAIVAAATTALTTTIFFRHPDSKVRFVALAGGILLSCLTALSRVEAGQHFPTDVITGLVVGTFAGFVVPYLHRNQIRLKPAVAFNPVNGMASFSIAGSL